MFSSYFIPFFVYNNDMPFLPLHIYSGYSFLRSGLTMKKIVGNALKRGFSYAAISDFETLTGFPELYHLCKDNQLTPIFGMDIKLGGDRFTLFIQNETGYRNMIRLAYEASKNKASLEILYQHQEGLKIVLNPEESFIKNKVWNSIDELAQYMASINKRIPNLYIGIPYLPKESHFIGFLRCFLDKYPYSSLAFPHILYDKKEDAIALRIVEAIQNNDHLEDKACTGDNYYLGEEELSQYYLPEELDACSKFVEDIHFEFQIKRGKLLRYPDTEGMDSKDYLRKKAYEGLKRRKPDYNDSYIKRLEYELDVIISMGYADYFLVVADYVQHAKDIGIRVGPSRGSAAGSLVAYALNIVLLDPIQYGLLFERFLNPKRASLPDIDIDFADIRREEIVTYLREKYGKSRVSLIVTMQTLGAKASLRDIGRVYDYPTREIDLIAKSIEFDKLSLGDNYRRSKRFKELVDSDPYYLQIVSLAHKIEGLPRQSGLHAAGVVLNDEPLENAIPVFEQSDGALVCGYEMLYLEEQGFLKMDLLALRNLTIIDQTIHLIKAVKHEDVDYASIPFDDKGAVELIAKGRVMGLFQLESPGMKRTIASVHPTSFEDVAAVIALFRPGPMAFIQSFADRKHGKERVDYPVATLKDILAPTYGIIVYQEQIMQIARLMAGFDFGKADLFRRAISKKDASKLLSLKNDFIQGCLANGYKQEDAEKVFMLIDKFANYGFPKSHSYGYAVITCQMAYLKRYYELPFYCAILNGVSQEDRAFAEILTELRQSKVTFLLPDVNASMLSYFPEGNDHIRFPLGAIHGINSRTCIEIIEERKTNGPYKDIFDFAMRNKKFGLKLETLIRLVDAGAFDSILPHRASLRAAAPKAIQYAELFSGESGNEILLDLSFPKPAMPSMLDTPDEDLIAEKEALGMLLSMSPLFTKEQVIQERGLLSINEALAKPNGGAAAAIILNVKQITTKKGSKMMFVTIYDQYAQIECTVFEREISQCYQLLRAGQMIEIYIHKDNYKEGSYIGERIKAL